jgi:hypothetical protein
MRFFNYLYCKTCAFYFKYNDSSPKIAALLVVVGMQVFNAFSLFFLLCVIMQRRIAPNKLLTVFIFLIFLVANGFWFNKYHYEVLKERWQNEKESSKNIRQFLVVSYIVLSTVLFFGLAIYLGSKKNEWD